MKRLIRMAMVASVCATSMAEVRTWTTQSGKTLEGEYESVLFDQVVLASPDGSRIKIPLATLSSNDVNYVELANPPQLSVDFLESAHQTFVKPSPMWPNNSPVTLIRHTFGVRVKQVDARKYDHQLTVEIFALAQQVYDIDKYHLVLHNRSAPFKLTPDNNYRYEYRDPEEVPIARFLLDGQYPRGQKIAECLVLVRDERGQIIAYNTTKNWLHANREKLSDLPVGAWVDRSLRRVHPTSPKPVWLD